MALTTVTASRFPHDTPPYRTRSEMQKVQDNFAALAAAALPVGQYNTNTATADATATAAQVAGAQNVVLNMTGALGAGKALTLPTAAEIVAAIPNAFVGMTYRLRVINTSSGNYAWTVTTATGLTLTGTMTVAQNTARDFLVTLTSLTAIAIQSLGQTAVASL